MGDFETARCLGESEGLVMMGLLGAWEAFFLAENSYIYKLKLNGLANTYSRQTQFSLRFVEFGNINLSPHPS